MTNTPKIVAWGAVLEGHSFDLLDWAEVFREPFDPWINVIDEKYILFSKTLPGGIPQEDAAGRASRLVVLANGLFAMRRGAEPIRDGGLAGLKDDGSIAVHYRMMASSIMGRSRCSGVAVVLGRDGNPILQEPEISREQQIIALAETDDAVADVLTYLQRRHSWFDLWKAFEVVEDDLGSRKAMGISMNKIDKFAETCNYFRHSGVKKHKQRMSLDEAEATFAEIMLLWINKKLML